MKLALFDDWRLGVVDDAATIVDVTTAVPGHDADPLAAGWWVRLCRDLPSLRGGIEQAAAAGSRIPLDSVRLRPAVLNPGKIVAAAANYAAHVSEMTEVMERAGGGPAWLGDFDVFLKAPSSVIGPGDEVVLPVGPTAEGKEVHHETELTVVIGRGGSHIPRERALEHVLGYTIALDITVRGQGDRSRRKSYDTFTPVGPWVVTADEVAAPHDLAIRLWVNGKQVQDVHTSGLTVDVPGIIAYASSVMRLDPGDVILTGAPPGVGRILAGDVLDTEITRVGRMQLSVSADPRARA